MPGPQTAPAAAAVDGLIYAAGGWNENQLCSYLNLLRVYGPGNAWTTLTATPMPTARNGAGAAVWAGKLYVIGGSTGCGPLTGANEVYNPATPGWTSLRAMPTARQQIGTGAIDGVIYAVGGDGRDLVEAYDIASNTWATKTRMLVSRAGPAAAVFNGRLYVFGGLNYAANPAGVVSSAESFNPGTNSWTLCAAMPRPRVNAAAVVANDRIYLIGGSNSSGILANVDVYDPASDSWSTLPSLNTPRTSLGAAAVNNVLYAFAGYNGNASSAHFTTLEAFVLPTSSTLTVPSVTGVAGGSATLSATLTSGGAALAGRSVSFSLSGNSVGAATTDGSGIATVANVSLAGLAAGAYPAAIAASFAGDATYPAANGSGDLTVQTPPPPPSVTWTGSAGDGQWNTAGNWDANRVPAGADPVVINLSQTVNASGTPIAFGSLTLGSSAGSSSPVLAIATTIASGGNITVNNKGTLQSNTASTLAVSNLTVNSGGKLTHAANGSTATPLYKLALAVLNSFTLAAGGSIDVTGLGHGGATGPIQNGYGPGGGGSATDAGGGGYGGRGGDCRTQPAQCFGGATYGSAANPMDLGSGGGGGYNNGNFGSPVCATAGGGAVIITAQVATLAGSIAANGKDKTLSCAGANGSGGTINIQAQTLGGNGALSATGGSSNTDNNQGGGGGGRIVIAGRASHTFTGSCSVAGGTVAGGGTPGQAGSAICGAPATPSRFTVAPASRFSITAGWSAVSNATSYEVQVALDATFTTGLQTLPSTTNALTVTGLAPATQYFARVHALNPIGSSAYTSGASATTLSNQAPAAAAESYVTNQGATLTVGAPGVLANDTDSDGDALGATLVATVGNGALVLSGNGSFTYTPAPGYYGADRFTYKATDGYAGSNVATVSITVNPVAFAVNSTADAADALPGNGVCATAANACTLRAAVQEANALGGSRTITFSAALNGTPITVASSLDVSNTAGLVITGNGQSNTIVQGCDAVANPSCVGGLTLLRLTDGARLQLTGATLRNASGAVSVGVRQSWEVGYAGRAGVTLTDVAMLNGVVGISSIGDVTIANSRLSGYRNLSGYGGAIVASPGTTLAIQNSTISGNEAIVGGAIFTNSGSAVTSFRISGTTFSGNTTTYDGGAVSLNSGGPYYISNSTFSGNRVVGTDPMIGGGALFAAAPITLASVTFSGNRSGTVGGAINSYAGYNVTLKNTVVAGSTGGNCFRTSGGTITSLGYNLFDDTSCGGGAADIVAPNAFLGRLADGGGPTLTHRLLSGSPAIDAGDPAGCTDAGSVLLATDQRGVGYPRAIDATNTGTARCDIGAVEILDGLAPVISGVPANQTLTPTSLNGAVATFTTPTAIDNVDGAVPVVCAPVSGATFPIGTTQVTCTAADSSGNSAAASFAVTVARLDQSITFAAPGDRTFGDASVTVGATASSGLDVSFAASGNCTVNGTTVQITSAGSCTITATQAGNLTYNAAPPVDRTFAIAKATPIITWANAAGIVYGTALGGTQLDATASVPGSFTYAPASGTVLNAGDGQTLSVSFAPTDGSNYNSASKSVLISVAKATPVITWANPADIVYGAALGGAQLNATADAPGSFTYTPSAGTVLNAGNGQTLKVSFAPTDSTNYNGASNSVLIDVAKATPVVTWANPTDIVYGSALGGTQLRATADVSGSFSYTPAAGTVLNAGNGQTLSVSFTPTDGSNYNGASKSVVINVAKATPLVSWTTPADILYGSALGPAQLNATASVSGTFGYAPAAGTVLDAGMGQTLSVMFTPADSVNYAAAGASVLINVLTPSQATQKLAGAVDGLVTSGVLTPSQGSALSAKLNAAITQLDRGNTSAAQGQLGAFINQVTAFVNSGRLSAAQGQALIAAAKQVIGG